MRDAQRELSSSTVLFGVATAFLVLASLVGCLAAGDGPTGATWKLRGTLIPAAEASAAHVGRWSTSAAEHVGNRERHLADAALQASSIPV